MPPSPFNAVLVPQRRGQHSGGMAWRCTTDVEEYDQAVGDLLRADPVVQTLPLTVLAAIRAGRYPRRLLGWWHEGPTWGAVLHTPPHELIVAALPEPAVGPLVDGLLERGWLPGGVFGATRSAALFAAVWAHRTGCQALLGHYQRLYALDSVRPPPQPNGSADPVRKKDRPVLLRWLAAFDAEAGTRPIDLEARVDQLIGECRALVWTDPDGSPVSVVAWSPLVAGMVRLGPVYTPPEHRRHGYASALTAAACRRALDSGARHLVLFTDLANPTSNEIYQRVGFRPVEDRLRVTFASPPTSPTAG
jgi:GNAT superfamily N-acetyltransferase